MFFTRICLLLTIILYATTSGFAQKVSVTVHPYNHEETSLPLRNISHITIDEHGENLSITTKDGSVREWARNEMQIISFETDDIPEINYSYCIENDAVQQYLQQTCYNPDDYEYSLVRSFANLATDDEGPKPLVIRLEDDCLQGDEYALISNNACFENAVSHALCDGSLTLWNATPGDTLYYRIMDADGSTILQQGYVAATGQLRMIHTAGIPNIRDLGGWPVEGGGHIRYGKLFRGSKLHDADNNYLSSADSILLRELGIRCEFDCRGGTEACKAISANYYSRLGSDIDYKIIGHGMYSYLNAVKGYPEYFRYCWNLIKSYVLAGEPLYFHCSMGCDRAGTLALILEGVLGMSENDLNLDYELGSFCKDSRYWRERCQHIVTPEYDFRATINTIKEHQGETLQAKFENYLVDECKIPRDDLRRFRELMIEQE